MKGTAKESLKGYAFISPWLFGFAVFTLLPAGMSLYYSFCDYTLLQKPVFIGLENYSELAHDSVFWQSLGNTFRYAAMALPTGLVIALVVALLINADIRGKTIYRAIAFVPSLVPLVASSMIWLWLYNPSLGLINLGLRAVHLPAPLWLADTRTAMLALVIMSFWGLGNTIVIYLAGLQDVPKELYEAADIDGATGFRKILHVTLPALSPVIFFNLIMGLISTFQIFAGPYIMTQGGPVRSTYFITMYLYDSAFGYLRMGYASAIAWIQLLIILSLTAFAFWTARRWVHYQGK